VEKLLQENNVIVVRIAQNVSLLIIDIVPVNPIPISKLYFSLKKV
jgi:hypothetical protein